LQGLVIAVSSTEVMSDDEFYVFVAVTDGKVHSIPTASPAFFTMVLTCIKLFEKA
jgi:hypothetical protein